MFLIQASEPSETERLNGEGLTEPSVPHHCDEAAGMQTCQSFAPGEGCMWVDTLLSVTCQVRCVFVVLLFTVTWLFLSLFSSLPVPVGPSLISFTWSLRTCHSLSVCFSLWLHQAVVCYPADVVPAVFVRLFDCFVANTRSSCLDVKNLWFCLYY